MLQHMGPLEFTWCKMDKKGIPMASQDPQQNLYYR